MADIPFIGPYLWNAENNAARLGLANQEFQAQQNNAASQQIDQALAEWKSNQVQQAVREIYAQNQRNLAQNQPNPAASASSDPLVTVTHNSADGLQSASYQLPFSQAKAQGLLPSPNLTAFPSETQVPGYTTPAATPAMIAIQSPDGRVGNILAAHAPAAVQAGGKLISQ
jgi:hypothetical protein